MAPALFISDLHLAPERPGLVAAFHELVPGRARGAAALYVIGDLFDAWLGDDQLKEPLAAKVAGAMASLAASGTRVYLQRGNRDFLLGERFAGAAGATLLPDAVVHDLYGTPTLIMHGDQLCTDDIGYQRLRAFWQNPVYRRHLSRLPYGVRRGIARLLSAGSRHATASKPEKIMDVNAGAVAAAMSEHRVTRLIHGHTHRPARHDFSLDGHACQRYVLADWYKAGSYLEVAPDAITPRSI
jgi:UDP-2,3-diacylglucosamine hydrolase